MRKPKKTHNQAMIFYFSDTVNHQALEEQVIQKITKRRRWLFTVMH
jgi:hypothetical protein